MLDARHDEVVSANLVLVGVNLLKQTEEFERFSRELDVDLVDLRVEVGLITNIPSGQTEQSRTITLDRERISLNMSPSRSSITRAYPSVQDLDRLAKVSALAIESTVLIDQVPKAFGYNIEVVFDQDSGQPAIQYIGKRLFGHQSLGEVGWELIGGTGQLVFADAQSRWTINLRPRSDNPDTSKGFMSLNLHRDEQRLPNEEEIRASLIEARTKAIEIINRLDERKTL